MADVWVLVIFLSCTCQNEVKVLMLSHLSQYGSSPQWLDLNYTNPGSRIWFPATLDSLFSSQLLMCPPDQWSALPLLPPLLLRLNNFRLFLSSLTHCCSLLIRLLVSLIILIFHKSLFPSLWNCWTFFLQKQKYKRWEPTCRFVGPLKCLRNTREPFEDFYLFFRLFFWEYI
jgi:hypothetical protein